MTNARKPLQPTTKSEPISVLLDDDLTKQAELKRMKMIATGLLVIAFIIFIISTIYQAQTVWLGFVQATAEAAMVGAFADWFAVTALFRHPLGLKIPHTAIIPRRKDQIGATLGRFVKQNFLAKSVIVDKFQAMNLTEALATWLSHPANTTMVADHVAIGLAKIVPIIKDEDVQALIEKGVVAHLQSLQIAPILGSFLAFIASNGRQQEIFHGMAKLGGHLLEENKSSLLTKIQEETPWWLPRNVDLAIYKKVVATLEETLQDVQADPDHPFYDRFSILINQFAHDLKYSPNILAKEAEIKAELIEQPLVKELAASLWMDIKAALIEHGENSDLDIRQPIQEGLTRFGQTLLHDPSLRTRMDRWVIDGMIYLIEQYGHELETLIAQTIQRWDGESTAQKLELQVGKDLQFIRINGTLVGGLIGLMIHTISVLLE